MTIAAGNVVFLKSGGQPMTVIAVEDDEATCIWTGEEGDLFRESIPTIALQPADEMEADEDEGDEAEREEKALSLA